MTDREYRLRQRIDSLTDERDEALETERELRATIRRMTGERRRKPTYRMCPYCGRPCHGAACSLHRDLAMYEKGLMSC